MDDHRAELNRPPRWFVAALLAAPVAFIATFYAWPVVTLLWTAWRDQATSASPFRHIAAIIWFTVWQAGVSTVLTLIVGLLPAYVLARYSFRGRRLLMRPRPCHSYCRLSPSVRPSSPCCRVVARNSTGDDRGPRVLQHRGGRSARRIDGRRDPARSDGRGANLGGFADSCRSTGPDAAAEARTVVERGGDLPVQLHLVRRRQGAGRAHSPDTGSRDRPTGDSTRRRLGCRSAVGDATRAARGRDRACFTTPTPRCDRIARCDSTARPAHSSRACHGGRSRRGGCRRRRSTGRRPRQSLVQRRQQLVAVGVEPPGQRRRPVRGPASASTRWHRSARRCDLPSSPR